VDVKPDLVVLDANHQLAGQDLIFDLELVEINSPSGSSCLNGIARTGSSAKQKRRRYFFLEDQPKHAKA